MPRAIALPVRRALWQAAQSGATTAELAESFGLSERTVRHLLHLARTNDNQAPAPAYRTGPRPRSAHPLFDAALLLKEDHPDWGARFIQGVLADNHPDQDLPDERTLRRWFVPLGSPKAPPGRRPQRLPRATKPHQRWQNDASDQMKLADGSDLSWLKAHDECSGAALGTVLFPRGQFNQVPILQVQNVWRDWFARWGLPQQMRLDNGWPWGGWFDLPTVLHLWLAGLVVVVVFNPPRSPRHNAVVERGHGSDKRWAEVKECRSLAEAQEKVNFADRIQREQMRSIKGQSRLVAFPTLAHSGRTYSRAWEEESWDMSKAEAVLEAHVGRRLVSAQGQVRVWGRNVSVGRRNAGEEAILQYDSDSKMWALSSAKSGRAFRSVVATEITRDRIMSLSIRTND